MPELLFIMLLALIIFGPAQLPKIGKQLGKALGDFKRASNDFKNQLEDEVNQLELQQMKEEAKQTFSLDPPAGTVAKGSPGWEESERSIQHPGSAGTGESGASTRVNESGTGESPASTRVPAESGTGGSPASTRVNESGAPTRANGDHVG